LATDDYKLIQDVLGGNKEAFRLLIERYQKPVFRIIYQMVNDSHTVEDITQEVFFTAYEKLATHDSDRSEFSTWLFTIARNKSINHIRKKKWISRPFDKEADLPTNPVDAMSNKELFTRMNQVLNQFPAGI
jgi:RNA polymerase sigma-70 factor (ECF subfamily)